MDYLELILFLFALVFLDFHRIFNFKKKNLLLFLFVSFVFYIDSLPLPIEKNVSVPYESTTISTICGLRCGTFVNPNKEAGSAAGGYSREGKDRGPDREVSVPPRYARPNSDFGSPGSGYGSADTNIWANEAVPPKSDWKTNTDYWKEFNPYYIKKKQDQKSEVCEIPEDNILQNKAGYDDILPDLPGHIYDIEGASAKAELKKVLKDPEAANFLKNGLERLKSGELTTAQQKELKGFKRLREYKFGQKNVRIIIS